MWWKRRRSETVSLTGINLAIWRPGRPSHTLSQENMFPSLSGYFRFLPQSKSTVNWWIDVMNWLVGWDWSPVSEWAGRLSRVSLGTWDRLQPHRDPIRGKEVEDGWMEISVSQVSKRAPLSKGSAYFTNFLWDCDEGQQRAVQLRLPSIWCLHLPKTIKIIQFFPHINIFIPLFSRYRNGSGGENPSFRYQTGKRLSGLMLISA